MKKTLFSSDRPKKCPDFGGAHRKVMYEDSRRPFKLLGNLVSGLLMSEEYQNKNITEDTWVCEKCYEKFKNISEKNLQEAQESTPTDITSSSQTPESQNLLPTDSQASIASVCLHDEVNEILAANKLSLSPFKLPSSVNPTLLPKYVNRKRKQLFNTFYEETDSKIMKLYDVSREKIEFSECKICEEWNENFSLALENQNLNYKEKLRLMTLVPSSLSNNYILSHIIGTTDYMIRNARNLVESKGLYESPDPYSGNPLKADTIKLVEKYYLDDDFDCTRQSPNKSDVLNIKINGVSEKKVKRFLTRSIKEMYDLFKEQNPEFTISRSKFYDLRPKWVIPQPANNSCLCVYCANFDLMVTALKNALNKKNSEFLMFKQQLLSMIVCSTENDSCVFRECESCKSVMITERNFQLEKDVLYDEITFAVWEKNDLIKKNCTLEVFFKELNSCVNIMSKHGRIKELQQREIKLEKQKGLLNNNNLILHGDFAENWAIIQKDAIQGYHWTNDQISIFTSVCYVGKSTMSFGIVSDDRKHDTAFALAAMKMITDESKKLTEDEINNINVISDGATAHFKNRFQFYELGYGFRKANWIFSATGHGKGACDGIGGLLKHYATIHNLSSSATECIKNADDFVKSVSKYTSKIRIMLLKNEEVNKFRSEKIEEWKEVRSIHGIRDSHIWRVNRTTDNEGNITVERSMRKTNKHEWLSVKC